MQVGHIIFLLAYGLAAATVAFALPGAARLDPLSCQLAGLALFMAAALIHALYARRADRAALEEEVESLRGDIDAMSQALRAAQTQVDLLRDKVDHDMDAKHNKLIAELKLFESLLVQVVSKKSGAPLRSNGGKANGALPPAPAQSGDTALTHALAHGVLEAEPKHPLLRKTDLTETEIYDIMRNALEDNRIDLYLQPIVKLPQRKILFYEAFSRVRDARNHIIFPRQYLRIAEDRGLIGMLDNLLLFRCIQLLRKIGKRKRARFFCNISPSSLRDSDFFPQFIEFMLSNADLSDRLVFEFAQADISGISGEIAAKLNTLVKRGFQFSMDQVTNLSIDFPLLASRGVKFVKIDAGVLLQSGGGALAAADLKEQFARNNVDLIVEKIETEKTVIDVLEYNIDYGQGFLFGPPRPSREDALRAGVTLNEADEDWL